MQSCTTIIHTILFGQHAATLYGCSDIYRTVFTLFSYSCEPATTAQELNFNYHMGFLPRNVGTGAFATLSASNFPVSTWCSHLVVGCTQTHPFQHQ